MDRLFSISESGFLRGADRLVVVGLGRVETGCFGGLPFDH